MVARRLLDRLVEAGNVKDVVFVSFCVIVMLCEREKEDGEVEEGGEMEQRKPSTCDDVPLVSR